MRSRLEVASLAKRKRVKDYLGKRLEMADEEAGLVPQEDRRLNIIKHPRHVSLSWYCCQNAIRKLVGCLLVKQCR